MTKKEQELQAAREEGMRYVIQLMRDQADADASLNPEWADAFSWLASDTEDLLELKNEEKKKTIMNDNKKKNWIDTAKDLENTYLQRRIQCLDEQNNAFLAEQEVRCHSITEQTTEVIKTQKAIREIYNTGLQELIELKDLIAELLQGEKKKK